MLKGETTENWKCIQAKNNRIFVPLSLAIKNAPRISINGALQVYLTHVQGFIIIIIPQRNPKLVPIYILS